MKKSANGKTATNPMKLYKLKDSVTDEMLDNIWLNRSSVDGQFFKPDGTSSGDIYSGIQTSAYTFTIGGGKVDLPPEWLEEVGEGADELSDDAAFEKWRKDQDEYNPRTAFLAGIEYERGRTK